MNRFLFWIQGSGEWSMSKSVVDYIKSQGDNVIVCLDDVTIQNLPKNEVDRYSPIRYNLRQWDIPGQIKTIVDTYDIEVLIYQPSRSWQLSLPQVDVKIVATIEANLQFKGVGISYKLDNIYPRYLDYYFVGWDHKYYEEAMKLHYGTTFYPELIQEKVIPIGWLGNKLERSTSDYVFVYVGSGMTSNQGLLQEILEWLPISQRVIAISRDGVFGNFPNLTVIPSVNDYDQLLVNAKFCVFHEGFGSISKALINKVPFVSIRNGDKIKYLETEPINILKYGTCVNRGRIRDLDYHSINRMVDVEQGMSVIYDIIKSNL